MRRAVAVAALAALGLLAVPALAGAAAEDQADGSGKFVFLGPTQAIVSAHGTPAAAKGNVQLKTQQLGTFTGRVDCLNVFPIPGGLRAIVEGPLDPNLVGVQRYRAVIDDLGNGNGTGARDRISVEPNFGGSFGCQPIGFEFTNPVDSGNFELKDRAP